MARRWLGVLLLALTGCGAAECLPASSSPERREFRGQLMRLVHVSQCPGLPTPKALATRASGLFAREQAFLGRVRRSVLAADLQQAIDEDQEFSRNVLEADCAVYREEFAETAEGRKMYDAQLRSDEERLRVAETSFGRLIAQCGE